MPQGVCDLRNGSNDGKFDDLIVDCRRPIVFGTEFIPANNIASNNIIPSNLIAVYQRFRPPTSDFTLVQSPELAVADRTCRSTLMRRMVLLHTTVRLYVSSGFLRLSNHSTGSQFGHPSALFFFIARLRVGITLPFHNNNVSENA